MSRVSCDSLVSGAKCVTVVIFRSLEVACAVARVVFSRVSCDSFVFGAKLYFFCFLLVFIYFLPGLLYKTSIFARVSCDSLVFGAKCETVVIFRSLVSRVSCDSFVFGAKCDTLVTFTSPKVARAVFRQHLHTCVQKLMIRCGFEVVRFACIVRFARFRSKVCNSRHF